MLISYARNIQFLLQGRLERLIVDRASLDVQKIAKEGEGMRSFTLGFAVLITSATLNTSYAQIINSLVFEIVTAGDDLANRSKLTAIVALSGKQTDFILKDHEAGNWNNGSTHSIPLPLAATSLSSIGTIILRLDQKTGGLDGLDNWDIQHVRITANGPGGASCVFNQGGSPFRRLTGSSDSVTITAGTGC